MARNTWRFSDGYEGQKMTVSESLAAAEEMGLANEYLFTAHEVYASL